MIFVASILTLSLIFDDQVMVNDGAKLHVYVDGDTSARRPLIIMGGGPCAPTYGTKLSQQLSDLANEHPLVYYDPRGVESRRRSICYHMGASRGRCLPLRHGRNILPDKRRGYLWVERGHLACPECHRTCTAAYPQGCRQQPQSRPTAQPADTQCSNRARVGCQRIPRPHAAVYIAATPCVHRPR